MEMLCPVCMGTMVTSDGREAVCTLDGKRFQILFTRHPSGEVPSADRAASSLRPPPLPLQGAEPDTYDLTPAEAETPLAQLAAAAHGYQQPRPIVPPGTFCRTHPGVSAVAFCDSCGAPVCSTCDFALPNGAHVCSNCATDPYRVSQARPQNATIAGAYAAVHSSYAPTYAMPQGTVCKVHPENAAVAYCRNCASPVCSTCDFQFPGNIHLCAACAAKPPDKMTPKRKKLLIAAYALAIWTTVALIALISGAFAGMSEESAGILMQVFVFVPALVGIGVSCGSLDKRLGNTVAVWISVVWNAIILVILLLLVIVGLTMRH